MKFGELIRKRREQLGLTQQQIDGVDQGTLSKIERGKQNPTKRELIEDLARGLQFSPGQDRLAVDVFAAGSGTVRVSADCETPHTKGED